jgi:hypothetical protein
MSLVHDHRGEREELGRPGPRVLDVLEAEQVSLSGQYYQYAQRYQSTEFPLRTRCWPERTCEGWSTRLESEYRCVNYE